MKIVHVFWGLTFGGIETMLVNIANIQTRKGHNVKIVVINDKIEQTLVDRIDKSVEVIRIGRKEHSKSLVFIYKLNKILHECDPSVIHIHRSEFYSYIFIKSLLSRVCLTLHDIPYGTLYPSGIKGAIARRNNLLNAKLAKGNVVGIDKIPKVVSISESVKRELLERYGVASRVICNGIDVAFFKDRQAKPFGEVLKIVQVSRLEHNKKGQDLLIRAIASLKVSVHVTFIGEGSSLSYLQQMTQDLGIDDRVTFLGKQKQEYISEHLCDYDLFVQPSRIEGFGLTVAEAMCSGVPVLVSEGQGPSEITKGNEYGWTFESENVEDLSSAIRYIYDQYDIALAKAIEARNMVVKEYNITETVEKYLDFYSK